MVEARCERRIGGGRRGIGRGCRAARPADRRAGYDENAAESRGVREQPRETVEPAVDRLRQHFLTAVLVDEVLNDLVARLAGGRQLRDFLAHRGGVGAGALADLLASARAAHADDAAL